MPIRRSGPMPAQAGVAVPRSNANGIVGTNRRLRDIIELCHETAIFHLVTVIAIESLLPTAAASSASPDLKVKVVSERMLAAAILHADHFLPQLREHRASGSFRQSRDEGIEAYIGACRANMYGSLQLLVHDESTVPVLFLAAAPLIRAALEEAAVVWWLGNPTTAREQRARWSSLLEYVAEDGRRLWRALNRAPQEPRQRHPPRSSTSLVRDVISAAQARTDAKFFGADYASVPYACLSALHHGSPALIVLDQAGVIGGRAAGVTMSGLTALLAKCANTTAQASVFAMKRVARAKGLSTRVNLDRAKPDAELNYRA
jgi:hypothetical protein